MSSIEKFLRDQLEAARDQLDAVEAAQATFETISPAYYGEALQQAKKRLGEASLANSAYLDERESYLGQIEDLREDMKPVRIEAFAKERVDFYQSMAYTAINAIEEAADLIEDIADSEAAAARQVLAEALKARSQMSRTQGRSPRTAGAQSCDSHSWRASTPKMPYGPGDYNRCVLDQGHDGYHRDSFGQVFQMEPFRVVRQEMV